MQLEVRRLSFSYNKKSVFEKVSFSAQKGDFICVLGENGAGKSTLLNCICRLLKPREGEILVDGRSVNTYKNKEFARTISFVPQNYNPIYECTVKEFLLMGRHPYKRFLKGFSQEDIKAVEDILAAFSMETFDERLMSQLSGGERKKILLMRALVQKTDVIILDEPTNQLDFGVRTQFMNILKRLADNGKVIIITTHLPDDAINYSNKTIIISDKKAEVFTREELKVEVLEELYSIKMEFVKGETITKMACVAEE